MSQFEDRPYWHVGIKSPELTIPPAPANADICIIGAGFTGLATALHLLRAGKSVVIFDAMKLGDGASGKNGGMIGPSLHKLGLSGLTNKYGKTRALSILQEGINAIEYVREFIELEKIDCDLNITGRFRGMTRAKDLDCVKRDCEELSVLQGFKYGVVEAQNIHSEIGSDLYHGGIVYQLDGGLQPCKLLVSIRFRTYIQHYLHP